MPGKHNSASMNIDLQRDAGELVDQTGQPRRSLVPHRLNSRTLAAFLDHLQAVAVELSATRRRWARERHIPQTTARTTISSLDTIVAACKFARKRASAGLARWLKGRIGGVVWYLDCELAEGYGARMAPVAIGG